MILKLKSKDIFYNLAVEEWLMENIIEPTLILWKSSEAIVMGKNQNPWMECRLNLINSDKIPLARRVSGGGTVYHDIGNLNYSIIVNQNNYQESHAFNMVLSALNKLGIRATIKCRSNLTYQNKKFSGTAFAFRKGKVMHHGTMLLNTNLEKLNKYLGTDYNNISSKAVRSVPLEVINLKIFDSDIEESLINQFKIFYNDKDNNALSIQLNKKEIEDIYYERINDNWIYGKTPNFQINFGNNSYAINRDDIITNLEKLKKGDFEFINSKNN